MSNTKPNPYVFAQAIKLLELHNDALVDTDEEMRADLSGYLATILVSLGLEVCSAQPSDAAASIIFLIVRLFDQDCEYDEETIGLMGTHIAAGRDSGPEIVASGAIVKLLAAIPNVHRTGPQGMQAIRTIFFEYALVVALADGGISGTERGKIHALSTQLWPTRPAEEIDQQIDGWVAESDAEARAAASAASDEAKYPLDQSLEHQSAPIETNEEAHSSALERLNALVGLQAVKDEVNTIVNTIRLNAQRVAVGMPALRLSNHLVFTGNPGTGKTTVARLIADVYRDLGVLSKGHLIEVDRSGLVAGYVGQTAIKVREVANSAVGGILFIDEAYSLVAGSSSDFGQEAIETLLKFMEDNRHDFALIVAGYSAQMTTFLNSNPGFQSRFTKHLHFADYLPEELMQILDGMLRSAHLVLSDEARVSVSARFVEAWRLKDNTFGNARLVRNVFEEMVERQANRLATKSTLASLELATIGVDLFLVQ